MTGECVYFLSVEQGQEVRIKVGQTRKLGSRLAQHRTPHLGDAPEVNLLCAVGGTRADEQSILRYFREELLPNEKEVFLADPDSRLACYIRWLRSRYYVFVPDDPGRNGEEIILKDSTHWLPSEERSVAPPHLLPMFDNFWGKLRMPPAIITGDDFYTHERIIEAARRTMGGFDLDAASHPIANRHIGAERIYTLEDNTLNLDWEGRVWLNPPFNQWKEWVPKLVQEWLSGRIESMCVLMATRSLTQKAVAPVHHHASAMCITHGRIRFWGPHATPSPDDGHAIFYFGKNLAAFQVEFASVGHIWFSPITNA